MMRFQNRFQLFLAGLGILFASLVFPQTVLSQDSLDINEAERMLTIEMVDLRSQLIFGLRTNLEGQVEFIDHVLASVESGEIPRAMVNIVFVWARKRNPRVPYPYFEIALRLLAERRGIEFPATDSIIIAQ